MITRAMHKRMAANAQIVARKYKKKVWWAELEDLEQEALLAQYDAAPRFDESRGTSFGVYAYTVALLACRKYVLSASAPVSCKSEPDKLVGLYRAPLAPEEAKQPHKEAKGTKTDHRLASPADQEENLDEKQFVLDVRKRLAELIGEEGVDFAVAVFTNEYRAGDFAEAHSIPVREVYSTIRSVKDKISSDAILYDFWRSK